MNSNINGRFQKANFLPSSMMKKVGEKPEDKKDGAKPEVQDEKKAPEKQEILKQKFDADAFQLIADRNKATMKIHLDGVLTPATSDESKSVQDSQAEGSRGGISLDEDQDQVNGDTQYAKGDVNHDGVVDVADISAVINAMAEDGTNTQYDVNGDGSVDIADISAVNTIMANGGDDSIDDSSSIDESELETNSSVFSNEEIDAIAEMLKDTVSNISSEDVKAMIDDITAMAESKGVNEADKLDYVSTRLVDFLAMRAENPNMTLEEMNTQLAIENISDILFEGFISTYSNIFGQEPDSIDALLEMQDLAMLNYDYEPSGRSAYINYGNMVYMQLASQGKLTNQEYYDCLLSDFIRIFPQQIEMTYEELEELDTEMQKLSPEQIMYFINKTLDLPSINDENYQEKYDAFMVEFNNAVSSSNYTISNPNGIVDINTVFKLRMGCEFNPDEIMIAMNTYQEVQDLQADIITYATIDDISEKYNNGELYLGDALWQIGYLFTNSFIPEDIEAFLKDLLEIDNIRVEGATVIIDEVAGARCASPSRIDKSSNENLLDIAIHAAEKWINIERGAYESVRDYLSAKINKLDEFITSKINDDYLSDYYTGFKALLGLTVGSVGYFADEYLIEGYFDTADSIFFSYDKGIPFTATQELKYQQDVINWCYEHQEELNNGTLSLEDGAFDTAIEYVSHYLDAGMAVIPCLAGKGKIVTKSVGSVLSRNATKTVIKDLWNKVVNNIAASSYTTTIIDKATNKTTMFSDSYNILRKIKSKILQKRVESGMGDCFTNSTSGLLEFEDLPKLTKNQILDRIKEEKIHPVNDFWKQNGKYKDGVWGLEGHFQKGENLRLSEFLKKDYELKRQGIKSTVREYSAGANLEKALAETEIGEAFSIGDQLYFKAKDGAYTPLSLTKEMYDKLFPPLNRFIINQGDSQSCWYLSSLARKYIEPETRYDIVKLFSQVGDDVYVKLPSGNFTYKFSNGEVPNLRELGYKDWSKLSNSSPWTNMLEFTGALVKDNMIEPGLINCNFTQYWRGTNYDLKDWIVTFDTNGNVIFDVNEFVGNFFHRLSALDVDYEVGESTLDLFGIGEQLLTGMKPEVQKAERVINNLKNLAEGRNISMGILFNEAHAATLTRVGNGGVYFTDPLGTVLENFMTFEEFLENISHVSNPRIRNAMMMAFLFGGGLTAANAANSDSPVTPAEGTEKPEESEKPKIDEKPDGGEDMQSNDPNSQKYDSDGYDRDGYDRNGYDRDGYDRDGYDRNGFNRYGERKGDSVPDVGVVFPGGAVQSEESQGEDSKGSQGTQATQGTQGQLGEQGTQGTQGTQGQQGEQSGQGTQSRTETIVVTAEQLASMGYGLDMKTSSGGENLGSITTDLATTLAGLLNDLNSRNDGWTYDGTVNPDGTFTINRTKCSEENTSSGGRSVDNIDATDSIVDWIESWLEIIMWDNSSDIASTGCQGLGSSNVSQDPNNFFGYNVNGNALDLYQEAVNLRKEGRFQWFKDACEAVALAHGLAIMGAGTQEVSNKLLNGGYITEDGDFDYEQFVKDCQEAGINPKDLDVQIDIMDNGDGTKTIEIYITKQDLSDVCIDVMFNVATGEKAIDDVSQNPAPTLEQMQLEFLEGIKMFENMSNEQLAWESSVIDKMSTRMQKIANQIMYAQMCQFLADSILQTYNATSRLLDFFTNYGYAGKSETYGDIGNVHTNVQIDQSAINFYIMDMMDRDEDAGLNSFQQMLRMSDRLMTLSKLANHSNEMSPEQLEDLCNSIMTDSCTQEYAWANRDASNGINAINGVVDSSAGNSVFEGVYNDGSIQTTSHEEAYPIRSLSQKDMLHNVRDELIYELGNTLKDTGYILMNGGFIMKEEFSGRPYIAVKDEKGKIIKIHLDRDFDNMDSDEYKFLSCINIIKGSGIDWSGVNFESQVKAGSIFNDILQITRDITQTEAAIKRAELKLYEAMATYSMSDQEYIDAQNEYMELMQRYNSNVSPYGYNMYSDLTVRIPEMTDSSRDTWNNYDHWLNILNSKWS